MGTKANLLLEEAWSLEDQFTALAGSAFGRVNYEASSASEGKIGDQGFSKRRQSMTPSAKRLYDLDEVSQIFWKPVFSVVCLHGHSRRDAQHVTQDFFQNLRKGGDISNPEQAKSVRFRVALYKSLQRSFLGRNDSSVQAYVANKDAEIVFWKDLLPCKTLPDSSGTEPFKRFQSAKHLFDLSWSTTVMDRALAHLREESEQQGQMAFFEELRERLVACHSRDSSSKISETLGLSTGKVRYQLFRLRQRYSALFRTEVAKTVAHSAEVDDEVRHLQNVLDDRAEAFGVLRLPKSSEPRRARSRPQSKPRIPKRPRAREFSNKMRQELKGKK